MIKHQLDDIKVPYQRVKKKKKTAQLVTLFALSNICMARRALMQMSPV